jgi:hypothetical protein
LYPNVQEPILLPENIGIAVGMNMLKEKILANNPSHLVIKFDNDCYIQSPSILGYITNVYKTKPPMSGEYVLSPTVQGISRVPATQSEGGWAGYYINLTGIIGGLFRITQLHVFKQFTADENLPKARGVDGQFANWFNSSGGRVGYLRDITVEHYLTTDGQCRQYPEYFARKRKEEGR